MLPTRLSPVTVDNQYIVSQTAAFSTICCVPDIPSDGVTNDITLETLMTGPCSSRVVRTAGTGYRPDEGPGLVTGRTKDRPTRSGGSWF